MAVTFPRLPRWLCGGGNSKDREKEPITKGSSSLNPQLEPAKFLPKKTKKARRGWLGREEEKLGNVVFPEPDDPEWSIGWVEPHGPGFKAADGEDEDGDSGFVVLVRCYKKVMDGSGNQILGVANNLPNGFSPDGKNMEKWMSSMRKL
ncbi:PREDICTED: uncharacterized protein LOC104798665 [Tarenaya hassleriana]|uniref:uncharacterized protein LOC104798665 n=1 Tax=Tarenaya hassleriana TaxID=28532 RepID=UPI00053C1F6A|nr:PREDICTED: uncharacterized protein LOC104798665 [Tarenaya hassleriana]XP_010519150.1 PREDICTED: uncharacterized protein LOC104798665 [Tarenaya hassleriana]XP_010519157.1 PREDICTED: uncharacterized protein LOC104798665 [Tarenaya hassleriana]XP_010519159.1 PREDICTED: uncharacterized protein LOC104798665 [Tarenaya hassleriana]XP_010519163.1 PREDICTED: uncharacterized protein LOC104798665 [Tarenaya hassleriana]